jgi:hypothetical protein
MVAGRGANLNYLVEGRFRFNSERYFILNANPPCGHSAGHSE